MPETPNVRLTLPGRAENVLVVRQALTGLAGFLVLDAIETNDVNTAATEACNNVVMHAYMGAEGTLEVDAYVLENELWVVVRDHGVGLEAHRRASAARCELGERAEMSAMGGMGLAVIDALAERVEFVEADAGGMEVRMCFALARRAALTPCDAHWEAPASSGTAGGAIAVSLTPGAIVRAILPRVLSALAARAHFSTDRIYDLRLIADALAADAESSAGGGHLAIAVTVAPRRLELRTEPLRAGFAERVVIDGLAPAIERLMDARRVVASPPGEALELVLMDSG
jgi:serine/threonine-protein kinase RsbW